MNGGRPSRVQLTRTDDRWSGRADLDPGLLGGTEPPRIEVGVLLPGFDPGPFDPGSGSDPVPGDRGRVARDAIRALARRRLNAAAERLTYDTSPYDVSWGPFLAETVAAGPTGEDY